MNTGFTHHGNFQVERPLEEPYGPGIQQGAITNLEYILGLSNYDLSATGKDKSRSKQVYWGQAGDPRCGSPDQQLSPSPDLPRVSICRK